MFRNAIEFWQRKSGIDKFLSLRNKHLFMFNKLYRFTEYCRAVTTMFSNSGLGLCKIIDINRYRNRYQVFFSRLPIILHVPISRWRFLCRKILYREIVMCCSFLFHSGIFHVAYLGYIFFLWGVWKSV